MHNPSTATRRAEVQNEAFTVHIVPLAQALTQDPARSPLPPNGFPERSPLVQAQQLNLLASDQATIIPVPPCARCGASQAKQVEGTGPHYKALRCANCDRFIKWLSKPKSGEVS